ncbi:MAG: SAM-dependent methyltransferase [Microbacterium sp.]|uniref:SAM-dependent methyltransferase n=1 Tax=Microbacterium sp. TaxID=51671 RepID=UPI001ACE2ABE|nr:SAM-dependent methyltransferase [Microbacterium sp.]MBN9152423.1 SAM-dependent methyltransferase [Microbacterium sp.]
MTAVVPVASSWLALREAADARARSTTLAAKALRLSRRPAVVHDLGGGTGAMARWLAPLIAGPQTWVVHDWNAALLDDAGAQAVTGADGRPIELRTRIGDLAQLSAADLAGASLVTGTALLDVLTGAEVAAIVRACVAVGAPALFPLNVTGRVDLDPVGAADRVVQEAFNDHQRRTTEGRTLLGPDAVDEIARLFSAHGWHVRTAESPWRLGVDDTRLIGEWLTGWLDAAVEQRPSLHEWAGEVLRRRAEQLARGRLRVVVHHRDVLAWPR